MAPRVATLSAVDPTTLLLTTFVAALITDLATGLGVLPFFFVRRVGDLVNGLLLAAAAGMMSVASLVQLLGEAMQLAPGWDVWQVCAGIAAGAAMFFFAARFLDDETFDVAGLREAGGAGALLIVLAMTLHSMPEGVAIGVAYGSGRADFGLSIALALAIHNIPEGVAIAAALRGKGVGALACLGWAIFSSLPQPIFAPPAALGIYYFEPLLPAGLGFAAGAMMFLVTYDLVPEAGEKAGPAKASAAFAAGVVVMLLLMAGVDAAI